MCINFYFDRLCLVMLSLVIQRVTCSLCQKNTVTEKDFLWTLTKRSIHFFIVFMTLNHGCDPLHGSSSHLFRMLFKIKTMVFEWYKNNSIITCFCKLSRTVLLKKLFEVHNCFIESWLEDIRKFNHKRKIKSVKRNWKKTQTTEQQQKKHWCSLVQSAG